MREIELTKGKVAKVSDEDFELLSQRLWQYGTGYAIGTTGKDPNRKREMMHRVIMNAPKGMEVDHIDGDGLNNQRSNLRIVTRAENLRGRHRAWGKIKYKGVTQVRGEKEYLAVIRVRCSSPEEAARMFDKLYRAAYGDSPSLNFPQDNHLR